MRIILTKKGKNELNDLRKLFYSKEKSLIRNKSQKEIFPPNKRKTFFNINNYYSNISNISINKFKTTNKNKTFINNSSLNNISLNLNNSNYINNNNNDINFKNTKISKSQSKNNIIYDTILKKMYKNYSNELHYNLKAILMPMKNINSNLSNSVDNNNKINSVNVKNSIKIKNILNKNLYKNLIKKIEEEVFIKKLNNNQINNYRNYETNENLLEKINQILNKKILFRNKELINYISNNKNLNYNFLKKIYFMNDEKIEKINNIIKEPKYKFLIDDNNNNNKNNLFNLYKKEYFNLIKNSDIEKKEIENNMEMTKSIFNKFKYNYNVNKNKKLLNFLKDRKKELLKKNNSNDDLKKNDNNNIHLKNKYKLKKNVSSSYIFNYHFI